jgi:hypothetical protein
MDKKFISHNFHLSINCLMLSVKDLKEIKEDLAIMVLVMEEEEEDKDVLSKTHSERTRK